MAVTHAATVRDAIANLIDDEVNAGTTDAQGDFALLDGAVLAANFPLSNPAFGAASSAAITLASVPKNVAAEATGAPHTVDLFELRDRDNGAVVLGTVTATGGGGDMEIDNTSITSGQNVILSSCVYTAPV